MSDPTCHPLSIDPIMGEEITFDNPDSIAFIYEDPLQPGVYSEDFKPFGNTPVCSIRENIEAELLTQSRINPGNALIIDSARKLLFKRERHSNLNFDENGKLNGAVGVKSPFTIFKITFGTGLTIGITPASVYKLLTVRDTKVFYVQPVFFDTEVINGVRKIPRIRNMSTNKDAYFTIGAVHGQDVSALPVYSISNIKNEKRYPITEMMIGADTLMGKLKANVIPSLRAKIPNTDNMYRDNSIDFTDEPVMERFWDTRGKGHDFSFWESLPYHSQLGNDEKLRYIVLRYLEDPKNSNGLYITSELKMGYVRPEDRIIQYTPEFLEIVKRIRDKSPTSTIRTNAKYVMVEIEREMRGTASRQPTAPRRAIPGAPNSLTPSQCQMAILSLNSNLPRALNPRTGRYVNRILSNGRENPILTQIREECAAYGAPQDEAPRPAEDVEEVNLCRQYLENYERSATIINPFTGRKIKTRNANGRLTVLALRIKNLCQITGAIAPQPAAPQPPAPQPAAPQPPMMNQRCATVVSAIRNRRASMLINPVTGRKLKFKLSNGRINPAAENAAKECGNEAYTLFIDRFARIR